VAPLIKKEELRKKKGADASAEDADASLPRYWAAEFCSAEAAELPLKASSGRCGKQNLPPRER